MNLYRIGPDNRLEQLDGLGASYRDGARWNLPGQPALYFACSPAVALLEMAHYLPSPRLVPPNFAMGIYRLPDELKTETLSRNQLPNDWAQYPYPKSTQELGTQWLIANRSPALLVPSAAVPQGLEHNALVNPAHPHRHGLELVEVIHELYNERIFAGLE